MKDFRGFTLIELLIVIAILGVLAAGVVVAINPSQRLRQARDSQRKMAIGQIRSVLVSYFVQHLSYPDTGGVWVQITGTNTFSTTLINAGELKTVPVDPLNSAPWPCQYYYMSNGGATYVMHFCFENVSDPIASNCSLDPVSGRRYCHPTDQYFISENNQ